MIPVSAGVPHNSSCSLKIVVSPACKRRYQLRTGIGASMPYHPNTHRHRLMQSVAPCRAGSAPKRYGKPIRSAGPDSAR